MAITLTYDAAQSRVEIACTGLADGFVKIERSPNGLLWETIRGATALEVVSGVITWFDYEFFPNIVNHYRVVAAVDETFDIPADDQEFGDPWEVPAGVRELTFEAWGGGGGGRIFSTNSQSGAGGGAYARDTFDVVPGETLLLRPGQGGIASTEQTERDGTSSAVFRESTLMVEAPPGLGPTDADTPGTGGLAGSATGSTAFSGGDGAARNVGTGAGGGGGGSATSTAGGGNASGSTGGTGEGAGGDGGLSAAPGLDGAAPGGGGGGSGDGSGVNGNGGDGRIIANSWFTGVDEQDTITPELTDVWLKSPKFPMLNRIIECVDYQEITRSVRAEASNVMGRSAPVALHDLRASREFRIDVLTSTQEEARDMDLILASGEIMLLHVPPDTVVDCEPVSMIPGGFVLIDGATVESQFRKGSAKRIWRLPCRIVNAPDATVAFTTLTWGTVYDLYGSWTELIAANPTWNDLLAGVGDPDDLVVL